MSWFRVDDKSTFHSKVVRAGNGAWGAFIRMGTWSKDHKTDGAIPEHIVTLIASPEERDRLLEVCLLEKTANGFLLHDYLDWNESDQAAKSLLENRRKAGRAGGLKSAAKRQASAQANSKHLLGTTSSKGVGVGEGSGSDPEGVQGEVEEPEPETSDDRYAEAYAQGQRDVSKAPYPAPVEPWERGAIGRFTKTPGWGLGLKGQELLDAIRAWSRDYRRARDAQSQYERGFPPKRCEEWARGQGWQYRPPKARAAPTRPVEPRSPPEAPMDPKAAQAAAQAALAAIGRGAA